MTSAISCPLWSSVYECQRVECAFTSPVRTECGMFVMLDPGMSLNCAPTRVCRKSASRPGYVVKVRPDPGMS